MLDVCCLVSSLGRLFPGLFAMKLRGSYLTGPPFPSIRHPATIRSSRSRTALKEIMVGSEALRLIGRLKNLPDLYDRIESAVCGLIHRYDDELFELNN